MLAVDAYEALLSLKDSAGKIFSKEKVLMRLAECYYRLEKVQEGLSYLERLQADIAPKRIYTLFLLRGKFKDLQREFDQAAEQFSLSLQVYEQDVVGESADATVRGNIQFRLGWALIRSRKDVDRGIEVLQEADKNLIDNADLKLKLAQILFQEKQDTKRALELNT